MNAQLPVCLQYMQALTTPALALLALVIGVGQWRTAHQRALLDLFDRRMTKYEAIRQIVSQVVRDGSVRNEDLLAFLRATNDVEFLFRSEVKTYLDGLHKAMRKHHVLEATWQRKQGEEREKALARKDELFQQIADFYTEFPKLLQRYVGMHQRTFWF